MGLKPYLFKAMTAIPPAFFSFPKNLSKIVPLHEEEEMVPMSITIKK